MTSSLPVWQSLSLGLLFTLCSPAQNRISRLEFTAATGDSFDVVGDFDGDSVPDYFLGQVVGPIYEVTIRRASDASIVQRIIVPMPPRPERNEWRAAAVGDVNGDGMDDVAVADATTGTVRVYGVQPAGGVSVPFRVVSGSPGLASSLSRLGDFDGDGSDDLLLGTGPTPTASGEASIISGATGLVLTTVSWGSAGDAKFEVFGLGDINGTGVPEFGLVSTDALGFSRATDVLFGTVGPNSRISGRRVRFARGGDYNQDGLPEYLYSASDTVLSGGIGFVPSVNYGAQLGRSEVASLAGIGDVDGDGVDDYAVGLDRADQGADHVDIVSGSGSVLIQRVITDSSQIRHVAAAGDADGDGRGDLFIVTGDAPGAIEVLRVGAAVPLPTERIYGESCALVGGVQPLIGYRGTARVGSTFSPFVRGAFNRTPTSLLVGQLGPVPLDFFGLPGCLLYVRPFATITVPAIGSLPTEIALPIPSSPQLVGLAFHMQWAMPGSFNAGLPLQLSNPMQVVIGR